MIITIYFLSYYLAYFLADKVISVFSIRISLLAGSLFNAIYVSIYLIPVGCKKENTGICNHGFSSFLFFLFALIGGCGSSIAWTAKTNFLQRWNTSNEHNTGVFNLAIGFSGVVAALFAIVLLTNDKGRTALYIIMLVLALNASLIRVCKFVLMNVSSACSTKGK